MRNLSTALATFALSLILLGCEDDLADVVIPTPGGSLLRGVAQAYDYSACDASGKEVVRGTMHITRDVSNRVTGIWNLEQTDPGASMIGPQVGIGTLDGGIDGTEIWINLNPQYADNNVMLLGTISLESMGGTWQFVGFPGVMNSGTFRAVSSGQVP